MKKDPCFYDAEYFGHFPSQEHKSNYQDLGGYTDALAGAEMVVGTVRDLVPTVQTVLELGCAHGATVRLFMENSIVCFGVDCSEYILSVAAEDVKPFLHLGDMHSLPIDVLELAPFDVIVSKDVLEHSDEESIDNLLIQLSSICTTQIHFINTGEYERQLADGDESHTLLRPLSWWLLKIKSLNLRVFLKAT